MNILVPLLYNGYDNLLQHFFGFFLSRYGQKGKDFLIVLTWPV